ncbi:MAG: hypothetical protein M1133_00615 [Armatimonadetes bacterium]|nr:hypothetical protein [Armatimonadota bacterium]
MLTALRDAGIEVHILGGKVAVMPLGGRIIGLYPNGMDNALWTNPALNTSFGAKSLTSSDGWLNLGGDRTWISPEVDTNILDPSRPAETYDVQRAVDPAAYEVAECDNESITLRTRMDVRFGRAGCTVPLTVTKHVRSVVPDIELPADVEAAGYVLESTMRTETPLPEGARPALWNLLQVPGGGSILLPVRGTVVPMALIGKPILRSEDGLVCCEVNTVDSFKFGIHVSVSRGISCYVRDDGENAALVVRMFSLQPDAHYSDIGWGDPDAKDYIHQVYVDNGGLGGFGELEHHSPALCSSGEPGCVTDRCQTWAFSGSENTLRDIAASLAEGDQLSIG